MKLGPHKKYFRVSNYLPPPKMVHICVTQNFFQWKSIDIPYKKAQGLQKSPTLMEKAPKAKKSHNKCRPSFRYEIKCTQSIKISSKYCQPLPTLQGRRPSPKNKIIVLVVNACSVSRGILAHFLQTLVHRKSAWSNFLEILHDSRPMGLYWALQFFPRYLSYFRCESKKCATEWEFPWWGYLAHLKGNLARAPSCTHMV